MIFEITSEVAVRLIAVASLREISSTVCPPYRAWAASTMVGVGRYLPSCHLKGSISGSFLANDKTRSITFASETALLQIGLRSLSWDVVREISQSEETASVAMRTGATNGSLLDSWKFFRSRA